MDSLGIPPNELGELERGTAYMELTATHVRYQRVSRGGARLHESAPLAAITSIRVVVDPVSYGRAIALAALAAGVLAIGALALLLVPAALPGSRFDGAARVVGWGAVVLGALCGAGAIYLVTIAKDRRVMALEIATPTLMLTWPSLASEDIGRLEEFAESIEAAQAHLHGADAPSPVVREKPGGALERAARQASAARYGRG